MKFIQRTWRREAFLTAVKVVLVMSSAALMSCSDAAEPPAGCLGDVELIVSGGSAPTFGWVPSCSLSSLIVVNASEAALWNLQAPVGRNTLVPPITYGVVPEGAHQEGSLESLEAGFGYVVRVFRLERTSNDELISVQGGEAFFRID